MVFEIWFHENHVKTRKKANFKNKEKTMKRHQFPENHQKTTKKPVLPEEYKLSANMVMAMVKLALKPEGTFLGQEDKNNIMLNRVYHYTLTLYSNIEVGRLYAY